MDAAALEGHANSAFVHPRSVLQRERAMPPS